MHILKPVAAGLFLLLALSTSAQKSRPARPAFARDSLGTTVLAINPVHLLFGHATVYAEFMNKKGRNSVRTVLSFGVDDDTERYKWAAGFHAKLFQPGHHYRNVAYVGVGALGAKVPVAFGDDAFLIEPQMVCGWQFAPSRKFNLSLEAGLGIAIPTSSRVVVEKPLGLLLGLILGLRV